MKQRKRYAIASGAALLLSLAGTAIAASPSSAAPTDTHSVQQVQDKAGHEDGTNDGETNDDATEAPGGDQQDVNESDEANEAPGVETDDDGAGQHGHEDGTNDGETNDDAGAGN